MNKYLKKYAGAFIMIGWAVWLDWIKSSHFGDASWWAVVLIAISGIAILAIENREN